MNQQTDIERVNTLLSWWLTQIKLNNYISFTDINKIAEGLVAKMLNLTYNYKLEKLEHHYPDHPTVDLGDNENSIAFQVTASVKAEKIETNTCNFFNQYAQTYTKGIRFLLLSFEENKIENLKNRKTIAKIDPRFQPVNHILSVKDLIRGITALYDFDNSRFQKVLALLEAEIPPKNAEAQDETGKTVSAPTRLLTPLPPVNLDNPLVGREAEMLLLAERLKLPEPLLLVNGLGGIGKTELCKRFFREHYHQYRSAAWVDYRGALRQSFITTLAAAFNLSQSGDPDRLFADVCNGLRQLGSQVLLVVDNIEDAEDTDLRILRTLPAAVLVSSRQQLPEFSAYRLDVLNEADCRILFYRFYKGKPDDAAVNALIQLCGSHTLTVALLASTARNAGLDAEELLAELQNKGFDLREVVREGVRTSWDEESTLKHFYTHLETLFDISGLTVAEEAAALGLAVLPSQFIKRKMVKELLNLESLDGVTGLVSKGWLQEDEESGAVVMHQVVRHVLRTKIRPDAKKCRTLIVALANQLNVEPNDNPLSKQGWVVFAAELLHHITEYDQNLTTLANNLSLIYRNIGQLKKALATQEKAVKIREMVLEVTHPDLATSYNNLSLILRSLGQQKKALEFQEKAIKIREIVLDAQHPDLATSYSNISLIYYDFSQYKKALEFQEKAIKIREAVLDAEHPDLAASYSALSLIYLALGQPKKALEFQEKAIKIREAMLDAEHPYLAQSYSNLSEIYQALGQPKKALELQEKAIKIREAVLDAEHPFIAQSYSNLSLIYRDLGQLEKALSLQEKAVKIREAVLDAEHPNLAKSYSSLSFIYNNLGQPEKALLFQEKAVKIRETVLDADHTALAKSYNVLSLIYNNLGQPEKALEFQEKAIKIREAVLDACHPTLAISYDNLSLVFLALGQPEKALEFQEKAIKIREAVLDASHPNLAKSYNNLSLIYKALGQLEKALAFQEKAIRIREEVLDNDHPDLAISYRNLAIIHFALDNPPTARQYCQKAIQILRKVFPGGHPDLEIAENNLVEIKRQVSLS